MLYFIIFLFKSGKLSLQNHVKSFSVPGVGWVYLRQPSAGDRAGCCLRSSGASVCFPVRAAWLWWWFLLLCGCEWPVHALRPLNLGLGCGQVCSCGEVSRNGSRPGRGLSAGSCAHCQGRSTAVFRPWRSGFCPGGIRGGGDASAMGSGGGRWRVTSPPSVKLSLWVCECWLSLLYSHNCVKSQFCS